ncbi:type II toxin-antitoxin system RelE/ParE family toxin [Proteiniphilum sp.]|uniref:type II toxin-antitoxin system RelE/ParE family toxin n=1 Tax=Proteiniphilum sp. TaxID=1926877 RepID=UPI003A523A72
MYDFYYSKSERAANKIITDIYNATLLLSQQPFMAPIEPALKDLPKTYRSMVVRQLFKLIYRVDEEKQEVIIMTIWDCRQNPKNLRKRIP